MTAPAIRRMFPNSPADAEIADAFRRSLVHQGFSEGDAIKLVSLGARLYQENPNISADDLARAVEVEAGSAGLSAELVSGAVGAFDTLDDAGGDPSVIRNLPAPSREVDAVRYREIQGVMTRDPSAYWRDQAMQDEALEILERLGGDPPQALATPVASDAGARESRRAEIKALMGDRSSEYWRGPQAEAMQAEYRDIIDAGSGETGDGNGSGDESRA